MFKKYDQKHQFLLPLNLEEAGNWPSIASPGIEVYDSLNIEVFLS